MPDQQTCLSCVHFGWHVTYLRALRQAFAAQNAKLSPFLACSEAEQLRQENEQLRRQLQHQQELLLIWQQQPCTLCQLHSTHANPKSSTVSTSNKAKTSRTSSSSSRTSQAQLAGQQQANTACRNVVSNSSCTEAAGCCRAVQCRLDRALRQQQVQVAQMQKQVLVLQVGFLAASHLDSSASLATVVLLRSKRQTPGSACAVMSTCCVDQARAVSCRLSCQAASSWYWRPTQYSQKQRGGLRDWQQQQQHQHRHWAATPV
jgi:primosomal replication protein N